MRSQMNQAPTRLKLALDDGFSLQLLTAAFGTPQTFSDVCPMSPIAGNLDIQPMARRSAGKVLRLGSANAFKSLRLRARTGGSLQLNGINPVGAESGPGNLLGACVRIDQCHARRQGIDAPQMQRSHRPGDARSYTAPPVT
jgi:hypothetical protein